jgi:hypothetical protein
MPVYTVLAARPPAESVEPDPVDYVFAGFGFAGRACSSPRLTIFRRLWLVLIIYLVAGA